MSASSNSNEHHLSKARPAVAVQTATALHRMPGRTGPRSAPLSHRPRGAGSVPLALQKAQRTRRGGRGEAGRGGRHSRTYRLGPGSHARRSLAAGRCVEKTKNILFSEGVGFARRSCFIRCGRRVGAGTVASSIRNGNETHTPSKNASDGKLPVIITILCPADGSGFMRHRRPLCPDSKTLLDPLDRGDG